MKIDIDRLISEIQGKLTVEDLKKEYREANKNNPMKGHCYVATEALFHILKAQKLLSGFSPYQARDLDDDSHWWLQNEKGVRLDLTADQYYSVGKKPPYENGRKRYFQNPSPHSRTVNFYKRSKLDRFFKE